MKKFFAFLVAASLSVSAFASREDVPSDAVLKGYYEAGQVCVCIFVPADMACNDIVFTGTYNSWASDAVSCTKFEAVEGYDGWYVVAFEDASDDVQGKPVMLDVDGAFNWIYQVGAVEVIRGNVTVVAGYGTEIDLKTYSTDIPNVYAVTEWKTNPCTAVYHNYTIAVINSTCNLYAVPFVVGGMNDWKWAQMTVNKDSTMKYQPNGYYEYSFKAAEGTEYQIVNGVMDETGAIVIEPAWSDDSYIFVNTDGEWVRINESANLKTGEEAKIVFDLRDADSYLWGRCVTRESHTYTINITLPTCAEVAPAISGGFNEWGRDTMKLVSGNQYTVQVVAEEGTEYGVTSINKPDDGNWDTWIEEYNADEDKWAGISNMKFGTEEEINLDFSDATKYRWSLCGETALPSIEADNVNRPIKYYDTDLRQIIILKDGERYNIHGVRIK